MQSKTRSNAISNVKSEALVNIWENTVAEVKPETLGDKLSNVKAQKLEKMRY